MKTTIPWTTDERGWPLDFAYHDGYLAGFEVRNDRQKFSIHNLNDEVVDITLSGLRQFTVNDFWDYPIIGEIETRPIAQAPRTEWMRLRWELLFKGKGSPNVWDDVERLVRQFPDAFLFQIFTSYGGEFSTVCDRLELQISPRPAGIPLMP